MFCRGTGKQLAHAVWRNPTLRPHLIEAFCKEIERESAQDCAPSKVKPHDSIRAAKIMKNSPCKLKKDKQNEFPSSCLRLTGKEDILDFTFEKFSQELKMRMPLSQTVLMRMPLSQAVLMTMCWWNSKRKEEDLFFTPAVCMAAAVCLKNRSRRMTAVHLIMSLMMQHSGFMVRYIKESAAYKQPKPSL
eukprot:Seg1775.4 transcript_id=Seg1775.4/GoldUCD/mRNA.D3Y31 product="hypothetical protein" protein_id=Seg1775.4/GoldUCD/D3Y31